MVESGTSLVKTMEISVAEAEKRTGKNTVNMQETYTVYLIETRWMTLLFVILYCNISVASILGNCAGYFLFPFPFSGQLKVSQKGLHQSLQTLCGDATASLNC